jgi:hypothetical protein
MAYRFNTADNPYIEISPGELVGDNLLNTSSGGWTFAVGLNRNGTGAWMCLGVVHDTSTEKLFLGEFNPSNQAVTADLVAASVTSSANTNTTSDLIYAFSWDGTDNVADNARASIYDPTSGGDGWTHTLGTWNSQEASGPFGAFASGWRIKIGNNFSNGDDFNGDMYVWGLRLGARSEAEIEALSLGTGGYATWETMFDVADSILIRFDNIGSLTDQANGTANETARSGAGISLVSDPSGFFGAAAAANPISRRKPRTRGLYLR